MAKRILFVCLGNICRSPMAEGVFRSIAAKASLEVEVDSAGLGGWHIGEAPDRRAQLAALNRGIDITSLRARQVTDEDYRQFDLMLAMDRANLTTLRGRTPKGAGAKTGLLMDYAPEARAQEVADPYFDDSFENAVDLIEAASLGLLAALIKSR